jgi:hypothetical protein
VSIDHALERKNGDTVFRTTGAILVERRKA